VILFQDEHSGKNDTTSNPRGAPGEHRRRARYYETLSGHRVAFVIMLSAAKPLAPRVCALARECFALAHCNPLRGSDVGIVKSREYLEGG
jgi:hypothetical protein